MAENKDDISQFIEVTGMSEERARYYLELASWSLEVAIANYYESWYNPTDPLEREHLLSMMQPMSFSKPTSGSSSKVKTLASLNKCDASSDEEEGQAFYAGGSENSGQQVLGPGKKKKDIVAEMFKSAQEHGAENIESRDPSQSNNSNYFSGTGHRLDSVTAEDRPSSSRRDSQIEMVLKLWREGFSVNDGPLREYNDPENSEFLDSVRRGEIPKELLHEAKAKEVHLKMEDHRHEGFVRVKPKVKAFSGKGHLLGSPSPAAVGTTKPMDEKDRLANEEQAKSTFILNSSAPITTVRITLADGSRLQGRFNHTQTIGDIRRFIILARPQYEQQAFTILATFPIRKLTEDSQTIADAGILNTALFQRLT